MTGPRRTGAERRGTGGWDSVLEKESYLVVPGAEWRTELWRVAVAQFERAADLLGLDPDIRRRIREPRRSLVVNLPIRRDTGEVETFTGYRVQHMLTMGPTKTRVCLLRASQAAEPGVWTVHAHVSGSQQPHLVL